MPLLKHAKKKQRQDKKRMLKNKKERTVYKDFIKKAKATKSADTVSTAFAAIDKAAKHNIIHDNKASRLKSALSKVLNGQPTSSPKKAVKADEGKSGKAKSGEVKGKTASTVKKSKASTKKPSAKTAKK